MTGLKDILTKLPDRIDLTEKEAEDAMREIMHGQRDGVPRSPPILMGLRMKR